MLRFQVYPRPVRPARAAATRTATARLIREKAGKSEGGGARDAFANEADDDYLVVALERQSTRNFAAGRAEAGRRDPVRPERGVPCTVRPVPDDGKAAPVMPVTYSPGDDDLS